MQHIAIPIRSRGIAIPLSVQCSTALNKLDILSNFGALAAVRNYDLQFRRRRQR